jgi:hypothetical protein
MKKGEWHRVNGVLRHKRSQAAPEPEAAKPKAPKGKGDLEVAVNAIWKQIPLAERITYILSRAE